MIIHIIAQNKLYSKLELDLIFKSAVEMIVVDIVEDIFKFFSSAKQETFIQKTKNLLNDEESLITNKII
jgi:hypothetical protein